jgi:hypothetical protein
MPLEYSIMRLSQCTEFGGPKPKYLESYLNEIGPKSAQPQQDYFRFDGAITACPGALCQRYQSVENAATREGMASSRGLIDRYNERESYYLNDLEEL